MSQNLKAILAFVSLVVTNLAVALVQSGQPWPTSTKDWGVLVITTALGTWLVWQSPNQTSDPLRALGRSVRVKGEKPHQAA